MESTTLLAKPSFHVSSLKPLHARRSPDWSIRAEISPQTPRGAGNGVEEMRRSALFLTHCKPSREKGNKGRQLQMQIHHKRHVMWISALTLSAFSREATVPLKLLLLQVPLLLWTSLKLQATMNLNGLRHQGSQESFILDNALRKKCSLWYRRSLRGSNDRSRQSVGSLPRGHKVGPVIVCVRCCSVPTHAYTHSQSLP